VGQRHGQQLDKIQSKNCDRAGGWRLIELAALLAWQIAESWKLNISSNVDLPNPNGIWGFMWGG
jgi:hypothetical protein